MPTFVYKAKKGPREVVEGELEARDEAQVISSLDALGMVPMTIQAKRDMIQKVTRAPAHARRGIKRREINDFVRSLSHLVKGNVPLLKSLSLLEQQATGKMKQVMNDLVHAVRQGSSLSEAMERQTTVFSRLLIGMVRGGESAGLLGEMLEKTADHQEKAEDLRKRIQGAMAYPFFVLAMGVGTIFVLLVYFMPRLMETYMSNNQTLPWPTQVTLSVGNFLSGNWYWLLGVFLVLCVFLRRKGSAAEGPWDVIKLKLPFVKSLVLKMAVVSFSRTLGLLLAHGVPLVKGVPLAADTVTNHIMARRLQAVQQNLVKHGATLGAALKGVSSYPPLAVALVVVGEESGDLAASLGHVAGQYERDVELWLKTVTTLIEPVMILLIGGIIGFVVFAMLMPIFQMDVLMQ